MFEIHSWLLHLCHTLITFLLSVGSYWTSLASKFQFQNVTKGLEWLPTGYYTIPVADDNIGFVGMKTPLHLGLLVMEDTYCLASLALVASLVYSIGTKHISIYTKRGLAPSDYVDLQRKISQILNSKQSSGGSLSVNVHHLLEPLNSSQGEVEPADLNVLIVDPGDGHQMLIDVTKQIAQLIKRGKISQSEVTPEYIDKILRDRIQCPDPDMALKFGTAPSCCGYLPWQLRLTEIISTPTLKGFSTAKLKKSLMAFSKIETRFGK